MNKKELKKLAKKIAGLELAYQKETDTKEKTRLEEEIMRYSSHINSMEDMCALDDLIQEILLEKN